jgi:hypothetical protein
MTVRADARAAPPSGAASEAARGTRDLCVCVCGKGLALLSACEMAAVVAAWCQRLCADEDASQHSCCDDSSGPAGLWEWKALRKGVAEASLQPVLLLMMEPRAQSLQALPSLEQAAQLVALEVWRHTTGRTRRPWTHQ